MLATPRVSPSSDATSPTARRKLSPFSAIRARVSLWHLVVGAAILVGAVERWWVAAHPIGTLTSDGGVIGLMALQILHHGQVSVYFWGQSYAGSLEAILTAAVFAVAGAGTAQLLATTALSSALVALALWRTARHIVGDRAALLGALVWWVFPATYLLRALKPGGTYWVGLALSLCAVGAIARIRNGERSWKLAAMAGLFAGLAAWSSPLSLELLVPAAIWAIRELLRLGRRLPALVAGALVGAAPAISYGLRRGWSNARLPGPVLAGYASRLAQFFRLQAPLALSLRLDGSFAWALGWAGPALAAASAVGFVAVLVCVAARRSSRCLLPVLTLLLLPFLFAFNPLGSHPGQSRYVIFGATMGALLLGVGLENAGRAVGRWWKGRASKRRAVLAAWSVGLGLLAALGFSTLTMEPASAIVGLRAGGVPMPTDDASLRSLLAEHHIRDAYAPYWIAYRVMFETREATDIDPVSNDRYRPLGLEVSRSADPSYLFISSSPTLPAFEHWCAAHRVPLDVWRRGEFTVVQPKRKLLKDRVPADVLTVVTSRSIPDVAR